MDDKLIMIDLSARVKEPRTNCENLALPSFIMARVMSRTFPDGFELVEATRIYWARWYERLIHVDVNRITSRHARRSKSFEFFLDKESRRSQQPRRGVIVAVIKYCSISVSLSTPKAVRYLFKPSSITAGSSLSWTKRWRAVAFDITLAAVKSAHRLLRHDGASPGFDSR